MRRQMEEAEIQAKAQAHYAASKEQNQRTKTKKIEAINNTRGFAYETKLEKEAVKRKIDMQKAAEEQKAQQMKQMIK